MSNANFAQRVIRNCKFNADLSITNPRINNKQESSSKSFKKQNISQISNNYKMKEKSREERGCSKEKGMKEKTVAAMN